MKPEAGFEVCDLCERIERAERGDNPFVVVRTATGYVNLADVQYHEGYTVFVAKRCVAELHHLVDDERDAFLQEMAEVARAVFEAFEPQKLNYELLGNGAPHLHWHLFPRHAQDPVPRRPVWRDPEFLEALTRGPQTDAGQLAALRRRLLDALERRDLSIERRYR
jgi:diadenosine tetraphosphate (Ap4A) HIT family hydrolase